MAITKIAGVVEWLLKCPVPDGDSIGPVGGGNIQHFFFNMEEAPVAFATSGALEAGSLCQYGAFSHPLPRHISC